MELLLTLKDKDLLKKLGAKDPDGIIFGGVFSHKYNYSLDEMESINEYCLERNIKRYISIDVFIGEDDLKTFYEYLTFIKRLNPDGIYFTDLAVINCCRNFNIENKLIYDPETLLTNSNDIGFYLKRDIDIVLARELTLKEIIDIVKRYPLKLDMQVFGHLKMSYSKRKMLSNYFKEINMLTNVYNKDNITLVEESRDYKLPIKENKYGTCIYSDFIFEMYQEYPLLSRLLKRGIIDTSFIDNDVIVDLIRDLNRITEENSEFLEESFIQRNSDYHFESGYLYKKTVDKKEENEKD